MNWTQSDTIALAAASCTLCRGLGTGQARRKQNEPCPCVLRAIFRACYARFQYCADKEKSFHRSRMQATSSPENRFSWGRKDEEYVADFCLVTRRTLNDDEYRLFKYHYLLGADWRLCCRKLGMERGLFFHQVYRIQQKLGRVYRELQPYALFPLDEYFRNSTGQAAAAGSLMLGSRTRPGALQAPLRKAA